MVYQISQFSQLSKAWQLLHHLTDQQADGINGVGGGHLQGSVAVRDKAPPGPGPANC